MHVFEEMKKALVNEAKFAVVGGEESRKSSQAWSGGETRTEEDCESKFEKDMEYCNLQTVFQFTDGTKTYQND